MMSMPMLIVPRSSFAPHTLQTWRRSLPFSIPRIPRKCGKACGGRTTATNSPRRLGDGLLRKSLTRISLSGDDLTAAVVDESSPSPSSSLLSTVDPAAEVVRKFYDRINGRDLEAVEGLIADDCVYEDLIFPQPFVGRKAILDFFQKFTDSISRDLQFVIDDISSEDTSVVGVIWHLEWKGKPFPFSNGCSFYRLAVVNGQRQIIYGRDSVEPAIKPGEMALVAIGGITRLLEKFPWLADRF